MLLFLVNSNASCRYKWIEMAIVVNVQPFFANSNASCRYKWIEIRLNANIYFSALAIPTPLVGINGLKFITNKLAIMKKNHSNASCRYKWIEITNSRQKTLRSVGIPTPLVGINGLKCKLR